MPECDFCEEEFESKEEMHLHWGEYHSDELNPEQEEKVRKAQRDKGRKEKKESKRQKDLAFKGLITILAIGVAVLVIPQLLGAYGGADRKVENVNFNLSGQPVKGNVDADVTMVEFGDYYCPGCKAFKRSVMPRIQKNYIDTGEVKMYHLDFPLNIHDPQATKAAIAAQCVYRQDKEKFWNYHDVLFNVQREIKYSSSRLTELAEENTEGLNYTRIKNCIESEKTLGNVRRNIETGNRVNISGTPTIYINGDKVERISYDNLKNLIEKEISQQ